MEIATILQIVRIIMMLGGSSYAAKYGVTQGEVEGVISAVAAATGSVWSLVHGIKIRKALKQ